jgi:hypothetical protein
MPELEEVLFFVSCLVEGFRKELPLNGVVGANWLAEANAVNC